LGVPMAGRAFDIGTQESEGKLLDRGPHGLDLVGNSGRAVEFVAVSGDYASADHHQDFNIAGKSWRIGVTFWFSANPGSTQVILAKDGNDLGWLIGIRDTGKVAWISRKTETGVHYAVDLDTAATAGAWNTLVLEGSGGVCTSSVLNDSTTTLTTITAENGTYGDSLKILSVGSRDPDASSPLHFDGYLAAISIETDGVVRADWLLADHATGTLDGKPGMDRSGNGHHLTFTGCEVAGADFPHPVPQLGLMGWNTIMEFDGVNDLIYPFPNTVLGPGDVLDWQMYIADQSTLNRHVFVDNSSNRFYIRHDQAYFTLNGSGGAHALSRSYAFEWVDCSLTKTETDIELRINGTLEVTRSLGSSFTFKSVGSLFANTDQLFKGHIVNMRKNGVQIASGRDGSSGSWGGATVEGSPDTTVVLASLADPSKDALGNPIDRQLAPGEFRPPEGGSGVIADDAAMANTKTVSLWTWYDGTDGTIVNLGTPTITASADAVATSGITSPTVYVNGVAGTALAVGWNHVAVTSATAFDCGPLTFDDKAIARALAYDNVEQSASNILRIYRATRSAYQ